MTDISAKTYVQSQLGTTSGLFQELGVKPIGAEGSAAPNGETVSDAVTKTKQEIGASGGFRSDSNQNKGSSRDNNTENRYTILVRSKTGEQRALTVKAGSADEAEKVASSVLDEDEQVTSVSESTVPPPPDPDRGLIA